MPTGASRCQLNICKSKINHMNEAGDELNRYTVNIIPRVSKA